MMSTVTGMAITIKHNKANSSYEIQQNFHYTKAMAQIMQLLQMQSIPPIL